MVAAAELAIPKIIQALIDKALPAKDVQLYGKLIFSLVPLLIVMFAASAAHKLLQRVVQEKAARDMQLAIFRQLRRLAPQAE